MMILSPVDNLRVHRCWSPLPFNVPKARQVTLVGGYSWARIPAELGRSGPGCPVHHFTVKKPFSPGRSLRGARLVCHGSCQIKVISSCRGRVNLVQKRGENFSVLCKRKGRCWCEIAASGCCRGGFSCGFPPAAADSCFLFKVSHRWLVCVRVRVEGCCPPCWLCGEQSRWSRLPYGHFVRHGGDVWLVLLSLSVCVHFVNWFEKGQTFGCLVPASINPGLWLSSLK